MRARLSLAAICIPHLVVASYLPTVYRRSRAFPVVSVPHMQLGDLFRGVKNPFADTRDGATTFSLTLLFRCEQRGRQSVLGQLDRLASSADTSTADGIAALCSDTSLMLLRRKSEWLSCCGSADFYMRSDVALSSFNKAANCEAAKFDDRDDRGSVDVSLGESSFQTGRGKPTHVVVCIVACVMGDRQRQVPKSFGGDAHAAAALLEELAAAVGERNAVRAFELLWVPGEENEVRIQIAFVPCSCPEILIAASLLFSSSCSRLASNVICTPHFQMRIDRCAGVRHGRSSGRLARANSMLTLIRGQPLPGLAALHATGEL